MISRMAKPEEVINFMFLHSLLQLHYVIASFGFSLVYLFLIPIWLINPYLYIIDTIVKKIDKFKFEFMSKMILNVD